MEETRHWVEQTAERIVKEKKPPYIINSGMTASGPVHLGTLCEFMYPAAIAEFMRKKAETEFYFEADIMDAFDKVPATLALYEKELVQHLGKPLCNVPDPMGTAKSFGEHFLKDVEEAMRRFEVAPKILRADELYAAGKYDKYALLFFERLEEVKKAVYESSLRQELPGWWSPIMPICEKCGKIATTRVTAFGPGDGGKNAQYDYVCDRVLKYTKGCGHVGSAHIKEHKYKITWRLDWPARQDFLNASAEGGGVDHFTRGGSWDTSVAIHERIFKKQPPVGYRFGFVFLKGQKYSKSKGIGMGVTELIGLIPPEVLKYALLRPDVQENKDIDTDGEAMLRLCEEYLGAGRLKLDGGAVAESAAGKGTETALSRADRKKAVAFALSTHKQMFFVFSDVLLYYQLYRDWKKVGELVDAGSAEYLKQYVESWIAKGFMPEEYAFEYAPKKIAGDTKLVRTFAERLKEGMTALDIHNLVFEVAREAGEKPEKFFEALYVTLINKPRGPRMGKLVEAVGILKVKNNLLELLG